MSLVRVMGPPWLQIWGTRILEERTASTMPVTRTSRLARGVSGAAAWATGGTVREQAARKGRRRATDKDEVIGLVSAIRRRWGSKCLAEFGGNFWDAEGECPHEWGHGSPGGPIYGDSYKGACILARVVTGVTAIMVYSTQIQMNQDVIWETGILIVNVWNCRVYTARKGTGKAIAKRITEAISHRGPDQQGVFEGSEATLCAVRLKIIDLEGGDQPILSDDRRHGDRVQRRNLQSSRSQSRAGEAGPPFPLELRYRNGAAGVPGVGHGLFLADAGNVRGGALDGVAEAPGAGARPDGDQAAVLLPQRRGTVFRIGTEGDPGASGRSAAPGPGGAGYATCR